MFRNQTSTLSAGQTHSKSDQCFEGFFSKKGSASPFICHINMESKFNSKVIVTTVLKNPQHYAAVKQKKLNV